MSSQVLFIFGLLGGGVHLSDNAASNCFAGLSNEVEKVSAEAVI
jgi:hypothetical protein